MALVNRNLLISNPGSVNVENPYLGDQGTGTLLVSPGVTTNFYEAATETTWAAYQTPSIAFSGLPQGVTATNISRDGSLTEPGYVFTLTGASSATLGEQGTMTVAVTAGGLTNYLQMEVVVQPCVPTVTSCSASEKCGSIVNNCGQTIECGTCASGES